MNVSIHIAGVQARKSGRRPSFRLLGLICLAAVTAGLMLPAARIHAAVTWSIVTSPDTSPSQDQYLNGISCVSVSACTAVGAAATASNGDYQTLVESWNGSAWNIASSADTSTTFPNSLSGVDCLSSSFCMAVGNAGSGTTSGNTTLAERWDGSAWSIVPSQTPATTALPQLVSVSCTSPSFCAAAGYYWTPGFTERLLLIETWNGASWTIATTPSTGTSGDVMQLGVSCVSAVYCVTVGHDFNGTAQQTLVEAWNGTTWSIVPSADTSVTLDNNLQSVSCLSSSYCTAVGNAYGTSNTLIEATLAETWNGTSWTIVASPNTAAKDNYLYAVSCTSPTACTAAGYSQTSPSPSQTLVETWDGAAWSIVASPNTSAPRGDVLSGVACPSAAYCFAVGDSGNYPNPDQTLVELGATPGPPALGISVMSAPATFAQGDIADTYDLQITNAPGAEATSGPITVTDMVPNGVTIALMSGGDWNCSLIPVCTTNDSIPAGGSSQITVIVNVASNAPIGTAYDGASVIGGGDPLGPHSVSYPTAITGSNPPPKPPSLSISKTHGGLTFAQNSVATYTLTVANGANAGATSGTVTVTDVAPAGLQISAMAGTGWTCTVLPACTNAASIGGGGVYQSITVTANVSSTAPATLVNRATVSGGGDPAGEHTASDPTTITGTNSPARPASLTIVKSHAAASFTQGDTADTYTIVVGDASGAGATAGTVTVVDDAPPGLTVTGMSGSGWTCAVTSCHRGDSIAGTTYAPITVTVRVSASAPAGMNALTNHASVDGGGDPTGPHTASDPTTIVP